MNEFRTVIPEVLSLRGLNHETDGRLVLMHTPTMTIVDVARVEEITFDEGIVTKTFSVTDESGNEVQMIMGVHCSCGVIQDEVDEKGVAPYLKRIEDAYKKSMYCKDTIIETVDVSAMN